MRFETDSVERNLAQNDPGFGQQPLARSSPSGILALEDDLSESPALMIIFVHCRQGENVE